MKMRNQPNPLPKIRMGGDSDSPMTSPNYKSSPLFSGPNTPSINMSTPFSNSPSEVEEYKVQVILPITPTPVYNPNTSKWVHAGGVAVSAPPLPPKPPKKVEKSRHDSSPPPPPLPPKIGQPPLPPRATPIRGVLESRSPHMDPVEPRREHHIFMSYNTHSPPALAPRRHSNVANGSHSGNFRDSLESPIIFSVMNKNLQFGEFFQNLQFQFFREQMSTSFEFTSWK